MKVMVCYDGSDTARAVVEKTIDLFKAEKPEIQLIMVATETGDASMESEEADANWKREREEVLGERARWVNEQGLEVDAILAVGEPRGMILEAVETKNPDIVVVGRLGESKLQRVLLGTVSSYLVRNAKCPVLVV